MSESRETGHAPSLCGGGDWDPRPPPLAAIAVVARLGIRVEGLGLKIRGSVFGS